MLDRIDPYGLLELSSAEMPQLLSELDELAGCVRGSAAETVIAAVRRLAEACRLDRDLRLRFVGD